MSELIAATNGRRLIVQQSGTEPATREEYEEMKRRFPDGPS